MELRHLRYFIAVAEELHFGRAAARLHLSQPPLSTQIRDLERELGVQLLERSPRRVALTEAGRVLLAGARRTFEDLELTVLRAQRASRGEIGTLAVGYVSTLTARGMPEILRAFRARYPAVELQLRRAPPAELVDALKRGRLDVALLRGPLAEPGLAVATVAEEPLLAALPTTHPRAGRHRLALRALRDEPFVLLARTRSPAYYDQVLQLCRQAGFTPQLVRLSPQQDVLDVLSLVAAGYGVSLLPASTQGLRPSGIAYARLTGRPTSSVLLAHRRGDASAVLAGFVAVVRATALDDR
jgi:DNA-binding transcriptional LysR family regulator